MQIDPLNIQGLHNLCVVYVERGKLTQARDCLQHAHKLAPQEDYILKHLKIVQQRLTNLKQAPGMHHQKTIAFAKYDPTDFGGVTADTKAIGSSDEGIVDEGVVVPSKSSEAIKKATTTASTQQAEYMANVGHDTNTHTKKTSSLNCRSTITSENRKFTDKSTILFNANNFIRKIEQQQINTNHRYRKQVVQQESSLPMFVHPYVHDMDDPSSGTS